jgi:hypothetical protein
VLDEPDLVLARPVLVDALELLDVEDLVVTVAV